MPLTAKFFVVEPADVIEILPDGVPDAEFVSLT